jgi:hypothetical protein
MTPQEEAQLKDAGRKVPSGTTLRHVSAEADRGTALAQFCIRLQALVPQLAIVREDTAGSEPPLLMLPNGVRYQGVPKGTELPPFIEALAGTLPPLGEPLRTRLGSLAAVAVLDLYVAPQCAYCPGAVRRLIPLAAASRLIRLSIIDASSDPELARRNDIRAVPTLVVDGRFRWTAPFALEDIVALILTRDPAALTPAALEMMLTQGQAKRLAQMMAERDALFPALAEVICHPRWPLRLGAMVAAEELNAVSPPLAQQLIESLWERIDGLPEAVRGDVCYLFGEIGGPAIAPRLASMRERESSADVQEALAEALQKLGG